MHIRNAKRFENDKSNLLLQLKIFLPYEITKKMPAVPLSALSIFLDRKMHQPLSPEFDQEPKILDMP